MSKVPWGGPARFVMGLLAATWLQVPALAQHEAGATAGQPGATAEPRGGPRIPGRIPPEIAVTPSSLSFDLYPGGHDTKPLHVQNLGL